MEEKEVALFEAEILERYNLVELIQDEILERRATFKDSDEGLDSMGYQLHNLYGAYEQLFEVVAIFFEGVRRHTDLLRRMKIEIRGVRSALISESTYKSLDEVRRFQHFFRHSFGIELDADRVDRIVQIAIQLREQFRKEVQHFIAQLK